jgi:hypothetical protein
MTPCLLYYEWFCVWAAFVKPVCTTALSMQVLINILLCLLGYFPGEWNKPGLPHGNVCSAHNNTGVVCVLAPTSQGAQALCFCWSLH